MARETETSALTEVEALLKKRFNPEEAGTVRLPSTAGAARTSKRVDQLTLPDSERAKMPLTKDKYLVQENPELVQWEREVRKFLRQLSPQHGHRVAAVMIYEWATGISVAELMREGGSAQAHLRKLNQLLEFYFGKYGKPYKTYIAGRPIARCYRVPEGYYIKRHRPMTLTLWVEYQQKTLNP